MQAIASPLFGYLVAYLFLLAQAEDAVQAVAPEVGGAVLNTILAVVGALGIVPFAKRMIDRKLEKIDKEEDRLLDERREMERRLAAYAAHVSATERWMGTATALLSDEQLQRTGPAPTPPHFYE